MSEGQTSRNEDNAFLPLSSGQISLRCEFCQSNKALCQAAEKTLKQHAWVSSPLQVRPSLMFKCAIRVDKTLTEAHGYCVKLPRDPEIVGLYNKMADHGPVPGGQAV